MMLGAQVYTLRDYAQNARDFRESMKRVAEIGYPAVQLSGIGNIPVQARRDICDEFGLKIVLTHISADRILDDPEGVIRDHRILGCKYIGLGMMAPKYQTAAWIDRFAKDFTEPAEKFRDAGMKFMYHNHNIEWTKLSDGRRIMDVLLEQMPADIMGITLDTYWVQAAGADIIEWIDKLQDRIPCVHLKDMAVQGFEQRMAAIGDGNINFPKVLAKLKEVGKTEYMLVEQDQCYGESPFDCLARSYAYVRSLGY